MTKQYDILRLTSTNLEELGWSQMRIQESTIRGSLMHGRPMIAAAIAAGLFLTGCSKAKDNAPAIDLAAEAQAIRDRSAEWLKLAAAKDAATIAKDILAPNAVTMIDGNIYGGAAAIEAAYEAAYAANPNATDVWTTDEVRVAASGDLAYELGSSTEDSDGDGAAAPTTGRYLAVWSKADGTWRAVADAGTTRRKSAEEVKPTT